MEGAGGGRGGKGLQTHLKMVHAKFLSHGVVATIHEHNRSLMQLPLQGLQHILSKTGQSAAGIRCDSHCSVPKPRDGHFTKNLWPVAKQNRLKLSQPRSKCLQAWLVCGWCQD